MLVKCALGPHTPRRCQSGRTGHPDEALPATRGDTLEGVSDVRLDIARPADLGWTREPDLSLLSLSVPRSFDDPDNPLPG